MAKEYCGLAKEHGYVSGKALPLNLVEYYRMNEKSLYPVVFVFVSCLGLSQ